MKVLIDSYNNVTQNQAGGVQIRIQKFYSELVRQGIQIKLFDKWNDKLSDYDVLHIFKMTLDNYHLIMAAKKKGLKIIISSVIPLQSALKIKWNRLLNKILPFSHNAQFFASRMLQFADYIVCESKQEVEFIVDCYAISKGKVHVIPNGVDIKFKEADPVPFREKFNINREFVLQVGRFDRNKNQLNVIRALKGHGLDVVFIGGPDPNEPEYYEKCQLEATENFHFMGWIHYEDPLLVSVYAAAKVLILPSYNETFGISLLEGGLAGANLVFSKNLPIGEWGIFQHSETLEPDSIHSIRNAILTAFDKPKDSTISQFIEEQFSWEAVVKSYLQLYV